LRRGPQGQKSRLRLAPAPARNEQIARRQPLLLAVTPDVRHGAFNPNPTAKKIQVGYSQRSRLTKPQAAIGQHEDDRPIPFSGLRQCCYLLRAQESLGGLSTRGNRTPTAGLMAGGDP
jgi:hypothetical protein